MSDLRDHSQECEHGEWVPHEFDRYKGESMGWCPGGREVTIDYEAGIGAWWQSYGTKGQYNPATRAAVDATIGSSE